MSVRVKAVAALMLVSACGSVDLGQDVQFSEITYDQDYFYCKVEPMLFAQNCGPGKAGTDPQGGCHYNFTTFRLTDHTDHKPIACNGLVPAGPIPPEAQSNYLAAEREMTPDPERAPLLNRPTNRAAHPRQVFDVNSDSANIIREWATKYTSQ